jgi:hypothetical protein
VLDAQSIERFERRAILPDRGPAPPAPRHASSAPGMTSLAPLRTLDARAVIALQRAAGNAAVSAMLRPPVTIQRCGGGPCDCAEGRDHEEPRSAPQPQHKAPGGESCATAADAGLLDDEEIDEEGMGKAVQRYTLKDFPPAEEAKMNAAVPEAEAKVTATLPKKTGVIGAIKAKTYEYHPEEGFNLCGWTFPSAWYIKIGKSAFDHGTCCDLASTIAHEASHTQWYTEKRAQKLECDVFGCSC